MSDRPSVSHCPICLDKNFTYQFTHADLPIVRCDGCTLLMRNPQPSDGELEAIYGADYFLGTSDSPEHDRFDQEFSRLKQSTAAGYFDRIEHYAGGILRRRRGRRLLDVGTGLGDLLVEAAARGYDVGGRRVFGELGGSRQCAAGRTRVVRAGQRSRPPRLDDGSFDVCVLSDVIEHTRDPMRVLSPCVARTQTRRRDLRRDAEPRQLVGKAPARALDGVQGRALVLLRQRDARVGAGAGRLRGCAHRARTQDAQPGIRHPSLPALSCAGSVAAEPRRRQAAAPGAPEAARCESSPAASIPSRGARPRRQSIGVRPASSVVMPVFNEKKTFAEVITRCCAEEHPGLSIEIVIVESNSTDGTRDDVRRVEGHPRVQGDLAGAPAWKGPRGAHGTGARDWRLRADPGRRPRIRPRRLRDACSNRCGRVRRAFVLGVRHGRDGHTWKVRHFTDQVLLGPSG